MTANHDRITDPYEAAAEFKSLLEELGAGGRWLYAKASYQEEFELGYADVEPPVSEELIGRIKTFFERIGGVEDRDDGHESVVLGGYVEHERPDNELYYNQLSRPMVAALCSVTQAMEKKTHTALLGEYRDRFEEMRDWKSTEDMGVIKMNSGYAPGVMAKHWLGAEAKIDYSKPKPAPKQTEIPTTKVREPLTEAQTEQVMEQVHALAARYKAAAGLDGALNGYQQERVMSSGTKALKTPKLKRLGVPQKPYDLYLRIQQGEEVAYDPEKLLKSFDKTVPAMEDERKKVTRGWQPDIAEQGQAR